ncbi:type II toxin-antitoxin system ParD family antitoxin [Devosia ginsengisoli]|uniref:ribbon-helix-helix domain-containing protein n=1 Tax=Devosia ginsengisoli TaxID=400770 RepID=UPI0026F0AB16|nr:type II toxin-antitoxin system ParD family antitoxin [Devosia ginsengisoli]MCR6672683.1 type II toxin-antitoxin system ParD family antitoxin [Devosia ginsengisoli]
MSKVQKRSFSLTEEQAAYIDAKVAAGGFATGSEVVRAGLRAMQERDAAQDRWLKEAVLPVVLKMEAHPERAIPLDDAFDQLDALIEDRETKKAS